MIFFYFFKGCKQSGAHASIFRRPTLCSPPLHPCVFNTPITPRMSAQELVSPVIIFWGYNESGQKATRVKSSQRRLNRLQAFSGLDLLFFSTSNTGWLENADGSIDTWPTDAGRKHPDGDPVPPGGGGASLFLSLFLSGVIGEVISAGNERCGGRQGRLRIVWNSVWLGLRNE